MNVKIVIEYDGAEFHGWQRQPNLRTVQGEIVSCLSRLAGHEILIDGSGRTDGGVHACGQVATFDWTGKIPVDRLAYVLNGRLPGDIYIHSLEVVPADFHARFSAVGKCYLYKLYRSDVPSPLKRRHAYRVPRLIDLDAMRQAAASLEGEHDFKSFMASGSFVTDTVRTIYKVVIEEHEDEIHLKFYGNGFLYNMVRILTGLLVDIGTGKKSPDCVTQIIQAMDRTLVEHTAAAEGLYLMRVYYDTESIASELNMPIERAAIPGREPSDESVEK